MRTFIILLLATVACLNPMCSGATSECEDTELYNEYVEAGSFTYTYDSQISSHDYFKIKIITDGGTTQKTIKSSQMKKVTVNGEEKWETSPVYISARSQVIVYLVDCEYVY